MYLVNRIRVLIYCNVRMLNFKFDVLWYIVLDLVGYLFFLKSNFIRNLEFEIFKRVFIFYFLFTFYLNYFCFRIVRYF